MPYSTPNTRCIFCGEKANSKEHAIPKWMSKRLGIKASLIGSGNVETPRSLISFASYRAKIFCKGCNAYFKDLEDAAIPLIEPMAKGWEVTLGLTSQRTIATWAAKTCIALLAAATPEIAEVVPAHHRRSIRDLGHPPAEMWISYFPWEGEPHIWVGDGTLNIPKGNEGSPSDLLHTYETIFTFRELGFQAVGFTDPLPPEAVLGRELPVVRRFWPPRRNIEDWPPGAAGTANREDIRDLVAFNPFLKIG